MENNCYVLSFSSAPANWCWSRSRALLPPAFWCASSGPGDTHTTATVSVHHRLERGLFFHNGLVRWTWVMDINTMGTDGRGGYLAPHTDTTLYNTHQQLLLQRDMGFMSLKPTFHSRSFQTRLPAAIPSPQICKAVGECSSSTAQDYPLWGCRGWFTAWHAKTDQAKDQK